MAKRSYKSEQGLLILGIAGGSASGKSTLAKAISAAEPSVLITLDSYYRPMTEAEQFDPHKHNFDAPAAIEFELLEQHLCNLQDGMAIEVPIYDFANHRRCEAALRFEPKPLILVEGVLALSSPSLRRLFTTTLFVDLPEDKRFARRLERDISERGRSPDSVYAQWHTTVKPMHDEYCEPSRVFAELILSGEDPLVDSLTRALELINRYR